MHICKQVTNNSMHKEQNRASFRVQLAQSVLKIFTKSESKYEEIAKVIHILL